MKFIGCDAHKRYSVFVAMDEACRAEKEVRIGHQDRGTYREYLASLPAGTPIALETMGQWYWMVDEIERAGHVPLLTHAGKAKLMMGKTHKTDKLDARGLALLLRNGTLPTVWIPPAELRDERELLRSRMFWVRARTRFKNRIQATLSKYGLRVDGYSDLFGDKARPLLLSRIAQLPPYTNVCCERELYLLDQLRVQIDELEEEIDRRIASTPEMRLVMSEPGIGRILAAVIVYEIGTIDRFPGPAQLASYAGTIPRVHSSGGKTWFGRTPREVNCFLKWAFVEAANVINLQQDNPAPRYQHALRLWERLRHKGHGKAAVAVARHLAEATYWILKKQQPYKPPVGVQAPVSARER